MGIALRDIKAATYYKGLHQSAKAYFFVASVNVSSGKVTLEGLSYIRRQTGTTWAPFKATGSGGDDSGFKRSVTTSDLTLENVPALPKGSSGSPATTEPSAPTPKPTVARSKPIALRKDGTPRSKVEGNEHSRTCLRCGTSTKTVPLFSFSTQFCPDCE
jgi:hypothetical protein